MYGQLMTKEQSKERRLKRMKEILFNCLFPLLKFTSEQIQKP